MRGLNGHWSLLDLVNFRIPTAEEFADKWAQRTSAASQDYAAGVENTDKDPTALAIANQARLVQNFQASVQSGRWANNLRKVGKSGWQSAVRSKGVSNFQTGVGAARDKVAAVAGPLLAFESNLQRQVQGMPAVTDADREARMLAWIRGMRNYGG